MMADGTIENGISPIPELEVGAIPPGGLTQVAPASQSLGTARPITHLVHKKLHINRL